MPKQKVQLGQYYTPQLVADWMMTLAQSPRDGQVLEPSCGEGVFLQSLRSAGFQNIDALEIDPRNAQRARSEYSSSARIRTGDFLLAPRRADYDLLIGNPPYVRWGNIAPATRKILEEDPFWKKRSSGEWDLLYAFLIGGAEMLRPGGEMIFVVPYNWFSATYAEPVRDHLRKRGYFSDIIHFGEYKLFPDAAPNAIVFRWQKSSSRKGIRVVDFLGRGGNTSEIIRKAESLRQGLLQGKELESEEWRAFRADQFQDSNSWHLASRTDNNFCQKIESVASIPLREVADVAVGMVSGYDQAFLLEDTKSFSKKERKYITPFVKARNCKHFRVSSPQYFIWADEIESEADLRKLPGIYNHLLPYKKRLLGRWGAEEDLWWHWATVRNAEIFRKNLRRPKIFLPCTDRSERARFSITSRQVWGSGDVLLLAPQEGTDPWEMQAWLGSELFNRWYKIRGPQTGQRRRYTQSFLQRVPTIPPGTLRRREIKKLIENCKALSRKNNPSLLEENEKIFARLFGI